MSEEQTNTEIQMQQYLQQQTVIIVDPSTASRSRLMKSLVDLGTNVQNIKTYGTYGQAWEAMDRDKPKIVISDYNLGKKSGFDLLQKYREQHKNSKDSLFILITSNPAQSLVARAAEEDIDSFIIKPYTITSLKQTIMQTALAKIYPSNYAKTIEEGKVKLFDGDYDQAINIFEKAKKLAKSPTLACFYQGQAQLMKESLSGAEEQYQQGLSYNKIHYKCLVSLFDLLYGNKRYDEAYEIVKKLAQYFPANPKRLGSVIRLSIMTNNVMDIEKYYETYKQIDERTPELIKNICAGLIICGKTYLNKNKTDKALELFQKAAISSSGQGRLILYIIEYLVIYGLHKEIDSYIRRFSPNEKKGKEFTIAEFLVSLQNKSSAKIIQESMDFIRNGFSSFAIYYVLVDNLIAQGRSEEAKKYKQQTIGKWPEKAFYMDRLTIETQNSGAANVS